MTHPITPPPELVQEWYDQAKQDPCGPINWVAVKAAQWGADQELETCCEVLAEKCFEGQANLLRGWRRPKPPSLNSIALQMLGTIERDAHYLPEITDTIRFALEALPND